MHERAIRELRDEAEAYGRGSPDWEYRRRAAWQLAQHDAGVAPRDWTTEPPAEFWRCRERKAA